MTRPADSARHVSRGLIVLGLIALAIITLSNPGATRMYAWPWSLAYAVACAVPALLLVLRLLDSRPPIILPSPAWCTVIFSGALVIATSALTSPYRGACLLWSIPLFSALALVFVVFDWLNVEPAQFSARRQQLLTGAGFFFAAVVAASLVRWSNGLFIDWRQTVFSPRNPFPLGHSNYTAGIALLMLPVFGALIFSTTGAKRFGWLSVALLALVMLYTSGSRGGLIGLVALVLANILILARALRINLWVVTFAAVVVLIALFYYNPRTRALFSRGRVSAAIRESNDQRSAMLAGGLALGRERPVFGWGPGATPLAYPRIRHLLEGGSENVLQLHSTPVELYAEFGMTGLVVAGAFVVLALGAAWRSRPARIALLGLAGYGVFSFTDWQFDVPVFAFAGAVAIALLAPAAATPTGFRRALAVGAGVVIALLAFLARSEPAPALNVRALALAREPAQTGAAIELLQRSLALNPDQEIAHFNLGWLLITRDPAAAEVHFLAAAQLVPDKGGVYFGLALARLNQGQRDATSQALALECVNDPLFLTSPWWRLPELGSLRADTFARAAQLLATLPPGASSADARYLIALMAWLENRAVPGEILAAANTSARVGYFAQRPSRPDFAAASLRTYRRERTGYPVLMRDLDLPVPTDLFDVQENQLAVTELGFLFPPKGWLPGPLLLSHLDRPAPNPKSQNAIATP